LITSARGLAVVSSVTIAPTRSLLPADHRINVHVMALGGFWARARRASPVRQRRNLARNCWRRSVSARGHRRAPCAAPRREPGAPPRRRPYRRCWRWSTRCSTSPGRIVSGGCCRVIFRTTRRSSVTFTRGATTARCSGSILSCWCLGTPSDIKSDCWATSSRIRERLPPEND
jgi:hypothetical protein